MPTPSPLSVNGQAFSYRDLRFGGVPGLSQIRSFVRSINFTNTADGGLNHGASQLGRHVSGPYSPTLDMEIAEEGIAILMRAFPPQGFETFPFNFLVVYAKSQTVPPFKRLRFREVTIKGTSGSWAQGTTELARRVPTVVRAIEEDHGDGIWRCPINLALEEIGL